MDTISLPLVDVAIILIVIVALVGCMTALYSWTQILKETAGVKNAETTLTGDSAWEDACPQDKLKLAVWLRKNGIKSNSHLDDFIRTCWSAWLGGRPASLTELHVLVARRERGYISTRLSAGISALLLVLGIVGTLISIKPVLNDFKFQIEAEPPREMAGDKPEVLNGGNQAGEEQEIPKDASSVAANTDLVNKLIHNLGNAFLPSLWALGGTIAVVLCRGRYSLSLNKFALEMDRFAVDTLIPHYRVPSLSEQYQEVKAALASVTESLLQREGRFHETVEKLETLVVGIIPALGGLDAAANASKEAAEKLASGAESITKGLTRHLGAKSPIHGAIASFEGIFEKTEQSLSNLSSVVDAIGQSNTSNRKDLEIAIQNLTRSVVKIAEDHQSRQLEAETTLNEFKNSLVEIPAAIQTTGEKAVNIGMTYIKTSMAQLQSEQKKWHITSAEELKITTASGLAGVVKAGQELTTEAAKIAPALLDIGNIGMDAKAVFKEMKDTGKTEITQIGNATKLKIEVTSDKLTKEVNNISVMVEHLSKLQLAPVKNSESRFGDLPSKKLVGLNASADHNELIRNVVVPPKAIELPTTSNPIPDLAATVVPDDIPEWTSPEKYFLDSANLAENTTNPPPKAPTKKWWLPRNPFSSKNS